MKAVCWEGKEKVAVEKVPDPVLLNPQDAIVRVTATCICGSDLHLYDGYVPTMEPGDILGHEFMGEVVETGREVRRIRPGDRVAVPFTISCGQCWYCRQGLWSQCDNSNPNAWMAEKMYGHSSGGFFGYSHLTGGYAGGQAEYARVPFADHGPMPIPDDVPDEQAVLLTDILPTGFMAADFCELKGGETVAVWGCGPVGQMAIKSAFHLGAERVFGIDRVPERLDMARRNGALVINYEKSGDVVQDLKDATGGRGPDACIDAVGMEAHGGIDRADAVYDTVMQKVRMVSDRCAALREAIQACRKGGIVSVVGVYAGFGDKIPLGAAFNKGLTFRMGQTPVQTYLPRLLALVRERKIDPSDVITHEMPLNKAPSAYRMFRDKKEGCVKVLLRP
jgi:threonine dehydrogenase-like Zn-dependent dehydrogenase